MPIEPPNYIPADAPNADGPGPALSAPAIPPDKKLASLPSGSLNRQVLILAAPMLGEQFVNFCVGLVDVYLAGRVGKEATAAVGVGSYISWFVTLAFSLIGVGAAAIVARGYGARDFRTTAKAANQSFVLAVMLGVALAAVVFTGAPLLAHALTRTENAAHMMVSYVRIDAFGLIFYSTVLICGGVLRAAGDTRTPMAVLIVVNLINALVSTALVMGWFTEPMGVVGIALGTVTARTLGGFMLMLIMLRAERGLRLHPRRMRPEWSMIARLLRIGAPAGAEATLMCAAQIGFIVVVAHTAAGDAATTNFAAHIIAVRMTAITYLPAAAWMTAAATMVGQYLGAKQPERASRSTHLAAAQGGVLAACVGVTFFLAADAIYAVMSQDQAVRTVGAHAFKIGAFIHPFLCMGIIYLGALRGAGDTRYTLIASLIGGLLLRLPLGYLGGVYLGGGLIGAWCGMWADILVKFALGLARTLHGGWKKLKV